MKVKRLPGGPWKQNCYVLDDSSDAVVIDPGGNAPGILDYLGREGLRLLGMFNTHGHFDHLGAVGEVMRYTGAPLFISSQEAPIMRSANLLRFIFRSTEKVEIPNTWTDLDRLAGGAGEAALGIDCIATPGHTPGSFCFHVGDHLFGGDTVLPLAPGNTKLPGGDQIAMERTLRTLSELPPTTILHPGHGRDQLLHEALDLIAERRTKTEARV